MDQVTKDFFEATSHSNLTQMEKIASEHNINVNQTNPDVDDSTPLHMAVRNLQPDIIRYLVEVLKADLNAKDKNNMAPIHIAISHYNPEIVKYLISKGSGYAEDAQHILNDEAVDRYLEAVESSDRELVAKMIEAGGIDVNSVDKGRLNRTALHMAATKGDEAMVKMLVDRYGADVNVMDEIGELPLHNAADNQHMNIVSYLVGKNSRNAEDVADLLKTYSVLNVNQK